MNSYYIDQIIGKFSETLTYPINTLELKEKYSDKVNYEPDNIGMFMNDLIQKARTVNLNVLKNHIPEAEFDTLVNEARFPILVFQKNNGQLSDLDPLLIYRNAKGKIEAYNFSLKEIVPRTEVSTERLAVYQNWADAQWDGQIIFLTAFPLEYTTSEDPYQKSEDSKPMHPIRRLFRLLQSESKDISYIYVYAIIVGLLSLTLPLGIQAIISLISSGAIFSSVVVLISLVVLSVLVTGGLQVMQLTMVEILQQRVFAKTAFEFIYRLPRIRSEALMKYHPPELMNRFFDILTVQKGLPKLLVDITGALIQIIFGLLLLSFYHASFLAFAFFTLGTVALIFRFTGPKGLDASLKESKYKYKIAHWLEEVARTINSFRLASTSNMPMEKMDNYVSNYLYYRKKHFRVLILQFVNMTLFKTIVTSGLVILGTILVIDEQITLGQFVASEVIVILVVGSVEKFIISMDIIYDLLTAVEKIGNVTDLPLEKEHGLKADLTREEKGLCVEMENLSYRYEGVDRYYLQDINLRIDAGSRVCISGIGKAGRHTLIEIILGSLHDFNGAVTVSGYSLRDVNTNSLRAVMEDNFSEDEIFSGTILDNISMGKSQVTYKDVRWAVENVGLGPYVNSLPDGLYTELISGANALTPEQRHKLILARCIASKPKLLIVNDYFQELPKHDKVKIINFLMDPANPWTLITLSNDLMFLTMSEQVIFMKEGKIGGKGTYSELLQNEDFRNAISEQNVLLEVLKTVAPKRNER